MISWRVPQRLRHLPQQGRLLMKGCTAATHWKYIMELVKLLLLLSSCKTLLAESSSVLLFFFFLSPPFFWTSHTRKGILQIVVFQVWNVIRHFLVCKLLWLKGSLIIWAGESHSWNEHKPISHGWFFTLVPKSAHYLSCSYSPSWVTKQVQNFWNWIHFDENYSCWCF